MIRLDRASKHFIKGPLIIRALDRVTLEVPKGSLALLRGPSGSGKTTLINVVAGLTEPTSGSVLVTGQRLENLTARERTSLRANRIAVVFQMFHLIPYLTAFENVLLPTLAAPDRATVQRANELLSALGISHRAAHFPAEMSAGERQRCALARALLNRPQVILADEPTGNLDDKSAQQVLEALVTCRKEGLTVLIATHHDMPGVQPDLEFHLAEGKLDTAAK